MPLLRWYDRAGVEISVDRYVELIADRDYVTIKQEEVGTHWVSTVWLGLDHSLGRTEGPILFETMVFAGESGEPEDVFRWATEADAHAGHEEVVTLIRATSYDCPWTM